ncbi:hypothetical protein F3Y22_tig00110174pilonHSYRG00381 [Hibiscus syriacus]|uniref:non-specific serine/threonine protein kinase n=1 Tax=Hibiscus syriacus TaxID=106335 RepID=A0A6A3BED0_HIBSY|nr:hypothetical protein F3Y22_tig00110174pilonHSYRG00381 [Hibiscus syriacus]
MNEDFGVYPSLDFIGLSDNQFYGEISPKWALCNNLSTLLIAGNNITGRIPPELGDLVQLQALDHSSNHLVGEIPKELTKLTSLSRLILSGNQLSGGIPLEVGSFSVLEYLNLSENRLSRSIPETIGDMLKLYYLNLSRRIRKCIPSRAVISDIVAVKKVHALHSDEGSLSANLSNEQAAKELDWDKRVNIIKGVAHALSYLHHDCSPPIVHRDLSSHNILLDLEFEAHISDFGTAKLLNQDSSNWTDLAGTYAYVVPELAYTMKAFTSTARHSGPTDICDEDGFYVLGRQSTFYFRPTMHSVSQLLAD